MSINKWGIQKVEMRKACLEMQRGQVRKDKKREKVGHVKENLNGEYKNPGKLNTRKHEKEIVDE